VPRDWDRYYSDGGGRDEAAEALLAEAVEWIPAGDALDLACGAGRHAVYLASLGWRVTAVDQSAAALRLLRTRAAGLPITIRQANLEGGEFAIAPAAYDLICDFYYLHRALFAQIRDGIRPGGMFLAAIHMVDSHATSGPHHPDFLLEPGELRREFAGWKISFYSEAPDKAGRLAARIVARKL